MSGETLIPAKLARAAKRFKLSPREIETLMAVCSGQPCKAAAGKLSIHVSTVKFHLRNVRRKTGAANCVAALWKIAKF